MTPCPDPQVRKRIVVTVISDLVTDYRVHKICQTLHDAGYEVTLIGSLRKKSQALGSRDYQTVRLPMWFGRTALFYAEFNIRLFFRLLKSKPDIYLGNDLDVMPATALMAGIRKKPLVYDSHEYFLGMAGLDRKPFRYSIWKFIENRVLSKLKYMYTVSEPIRDLYQKDFKGSLFIVRNLPLRNPVLPAISPSEMEFVESVNRRIPPNKNLLLLQGAGINESRGAEELVCCMRYLTSDFHLLIVGGGDVFEKLKKIIDKYQLQEKITIVPKVPFALLGHFTRKAMLGFSIDKPSVLNHRYSLPNKLFEYLHAGVPVLASRLAEQEKIIIHYDVGGFIENHQPEHIAGKIEEIFKSPGVLQTWKTNTANVREQLNWENESKIVLDIFKQVERDSVIS